MKKLESVEFPLDPYFKGTLYPFQTVGANFLYRSKRALLGDPVGLGKTVMAIAAGLMALTQGKIEFMLIVVPANLATKWHKEVEKFTTLDAVNMKYVGKRLPAYKKLFETEHRNTMIAITSYASLVRDCFKGDKIRNDGLISLLKKSNIKLGIVFDEIQKCKHRTSKRTQAALALADYAEHAYGLSATYIEGRLEELFNVFKVVQPKALGTFPRFAAAHFIENMDGKVVRYKNLERVRHTIDPYVIRRLVEDVGVQMPREIYQEYWINLSETQQGLYRTLVDDHLAILNSGGNVLVEMLKERECCLSTELINPEIRESPKIEALKDIIESLEPDAKVVVFCFFADRVPMVDIIERELVEHGRLQYNPYEVLKLKGKMSDAEMDKVRDKFAEDPKCKVLVTSDVSKEGHDLVAARHLVHFDLLWNPAQMRQRSGRIVRLTQKASQVVFHTIITKGTIEEYMWEVVMRKGEVMKQIQDAGREEVRITKLEAINILENYRG